MSIHIEAKPGDIAEGILLPGDPLRAQRIAETMLEAPACFNRVRGMLGFTGTWKGLRVSVMGTGMGQPSLSIYVNELLRDYGVKKLIRVGTCGSLRPELGLRDIVLAMAASTDSAINSLRFPGMHYAPAADYGLLKAAEAAAAAKGLRAVAGPILSSDSFYTEDPDQWKLWARFGVLAVEMESAELFTLAAKFGARALSVLTVSDSLISHEAMPSAERERSMGDMAEIALSALAS
jgi:purine-nucleoside phosphorylase